MSNTNKSAAPITTLLLAAVVALELTGMQALHTNGRTLTATSIDGDAGYMLVDNTASTATAVVAQAGN